MPDFNDLINKISEYRTQLENAAGDQEKVANITEEMLETLHEGLEKLAKKGQEAGDAIAGGQAKASRALADTDRTTTRLEKSLDKAGKTGDAAGDKLTDSFDSAKRSIKETGAHVDSLAKKLGKVADGAMNMVGALSKGDIGGAIGQLSPRLGKIAGAMQQIFDRSRRLNRSFLEFAGATQEFGKAAARADHYRLTINSVATQMGLTLEETHAYARTMQEVGFGLEDITGKTEIAGRKMMTLKAVQAAGISIGASFGETNRLMAESMLYLGKTSEEAVKGIVNIGVAARQAGTSVRILMPVVTNLMGQFRFLGMDVEKTTDLVARAGIDSRRAAADVTLMGRAVGQMLQMQPGAQAFFGMMGGMPGARGRGAIGAQLGFERALAGRGGAGPEQAFAAISQTLRQVTGGGVVGQERVLEGGASRQEEQRFFIQRQLLQQQMGLGRQEAGRLLEIMSKMEAGTAKVADKTELDRIMKSAGKDQAAYVRLTYESSKRLETLIAQQTQRLAGRMTNIFGTNKAILKTVIAGIAIAGGINLATKAFGKTLSRAVGRGFFGGGAAARRVTGAGRGAARLGRLARVGRVVGRGAPVLGSVLAAGAEVATARAEGATGKQTAVRAAGAGIGTGLGAAGGAKLGAVIGTFIAPGIGTAIGAGLGALAGGIVGTITGTKGGRALAKRLEENRKREEEKVQYEGLIAERKKDLEALKDNRQEYRRVKNELQEFERTLKQITVEQAIEKKGGTIAEATGGVGGLISALKGGGSKLHLTKRNVSEYLRGETTSLGEDLSSKELGIIQRYVAGFKDVQRSKDIKEVFKKGMAFLSPGDTVVDKDSIADIMSGERGSAFPQTIQKAISAMGPVSPLARLIGGAVGDREPGAAGAVAAAMERAEQGGMNEITINVRGEGVFENIIDERVKMNVKNGTIVGTQKTMQEAKA